MKGPGNGLYERVARLHAEGIGRGFLSTLGIRFLALLYQAVDESEGGALLVAREGDRIVGFAAGTLGTGQVYRAMLRHRLRLAAALLPALLSPRKVARILETVRYGRKGPESGDPPPSAELLSISVDPEFRGRGHAEALYRDLTGFFRSQRAARFKIIAGESLAPAHRFYRKMGARAVRTIEVHRGEKSIMYVQEVD